MADEPTKDELYEQAQELDVEGRSDMNKDELAEAVAEAGGDAGGAADDESTDAPTPTNQPVKKTAAAKDEPSGLGNKATVPTTLGPGAKQDEVKSPSQIKPEKSPFGDKD